MRCVVVGAGFFLALSSCVLFLHISSSFSVLRILMFFLIVVFLLLLLFWHFFICYLRSALRTDAALSPSAFRHLLFPYPVASSSFFCFSLLVCPLSETRSPPAHRFELFFSTTRSVSPFRTSGCRSLIATRSTPPRCTYACRWVTLLFRAHTTRVPLPLYCQRCVNSLMGCFCLAHWNVLPCSLLSALLACLFCRLPLRTPFGVSPLRLPIYHLTCLYSSHFHSQLPYAVCTRLPSYSFRGSAFWCYDTHRLASPPSCRYGPRPFMVFTPLLHRLLFLSALFLLLVFPSVLSCWLLLLLLCLSFFPFTISTYTGVSALAT